MDISFPQLPSTTIRHQLDKVHVDTLGPKSHTQSLAARPSTTRPDPQNAFMHSGFPRRPLLPAVPDISPIRTPARKMPPTLTTPIPASPGYSEVTYNTTPGYITPGPNSARTYPKFVAEKVQMPATSVADLAMAVAARYPRGRATPAFYAQGVKVPPSLVVRDVRTLGREGAGDSSPGRKGEARRRGDHEV